MSDFKVKMHQIVCQLGLCWGKKEGKEGEGKGCGGEKAGLPPLHAKVWPPELFSWRRR